MLKTDSHPAASPSRSLRGGVSQEIKALVKSLMGEFFLFSASSAFYQGSRFLVLLLVARWVGPEQFGLWNALSLILVYGSIVGLGVPNGMNREVPKLQGQGNQEEAQQIANFAFWFTLLASGAFALVIALAAMVPGLSTESRFPLFWMSVLFFATQMYVYFQMLLKCHIRFRIMSLQQIAFALANPLVVLPLAYWWGLNGFILGQALVTMGICLLIRQISPLRVGAAFKWYGFMPLAKIGLPIMGAGLLYGLLTTVDRWVILRYLGVEALGQYAVPILTLGMLSLLPKVVGEQLYPRMAFRFGQTSDISSLAPLIIKQSALAGLATLPVVILVYVSLPFFVGHFLPAYLSGVSPARILLIGLVFMSLVGGVANFLNIVDKQVYYLAVQGAMLVVNLLLGVLFVKLGLGLNGVALAGSVTFGLYAVTLISVAFFILRRNHKN
jgi:O-antigen/teichoic acid export membrane protein